MPYWPYGSDWVAREMSCLITVVVAELDFLPIGLFRFASLVAPARSDGAPSPAAGLACSLEGNRGSPFLVSYVLIG